MTCNCKYYERVEGRLVCSVCGQPPKKAAMAHEDKMLHRPIENKRGKRK